MEIAFHGIALLTLFDKLWLIHLIGQCGCWTLLATREICLPSTLCPFMKEFTTVNKAIQRPTREIRHGSQLHQHILGQFRWQLLRASMILSQPAYQGCTGCDLLRVEAKDTLEREILRLTDAQRPGRALCGHASQQAALAGGKRPQDAHS